ncbi:CoaE-domain-containing protein [Rickenella mellea]|uniref:CoaE-domain-containing protein n=1 Tax=Rickenella mellea TaxID=50990 RepID=A0A4Y7QJ13_9AGAM|nr:CoaE-domain-containing protein [Rickenella mellea]
MLVVGLTGGIATGKSTVSALVKARGIPVIDADVLARQVVLPGMRAHSKIVSFFGPSILLSDGTIDRAKLGTEVFNDEKKRRTLNSIVHPAVRRAMLWNVLICWLRGEKLCFVDIPLLVEVGLWKWVGKVVVVYCSPALQLQRLTARDKSNVDAAMSRIDAQLPITEKVKYADYVIDNSGSLHQLEDQIDVVVQRLYKGVKWTWFISWVVPPIGILLALRTLAQRYRKRINTNL